MSTTSFNLQPESSNNYFTYNASYALSQSSTGSPGTYQTWDFTGNGYYCSLGAVKSSTGNVLTWLKTDGTNIFQNSCADNACVWEADINASLQINWYNVRHGKYLGLNTTTGQLALYSTTGANTLWTNDTEIEWGDTVVNPMYLTIGGINYFLYADLDGYTVSVSTSVDGTNQCYQWSTNDSVPMQTLAPYMQSVYLNSNGDSTLTVNSTQQEWTAIPLNSTYSVLVLQSINDGYLQFNSDGTTMSENISTPTPYAGAMSTECQIRPTETYFLARKQLAKERRLQRMRELQEKGLQTKSESKVEEVIEEREETPKAEEFVEEKQTRSDFLEKLNTLESIGFTDRTKNIESLIQTRANIQETIKILLGTPNK